MDLCDVGPRTHLELHIAQVVAPLEEEEVDVATSRGRSCGRILHN